jgi:hypothetical protein
MTTAEPSLSLESRCSRWSLDGRDRHAWHGILAQAKEEGRLEDLYRLTNEEKAWGVGGLMRYVCLIEAGLERTTARDLKVDVEAFLHEHYADILEVILTRHGFGQTDRQKALLDMIRNKTFQANFGSILVAKSEAVHSAAVQSATAECDRQVKAAREEYEAAISRSQSYTEHVEGFFSPDKPSPAREESEEAFRQRFPRARRIHSTEQIQPGHYKCRDGKFILILESDKFSGLEQGGVIWATGIPLEN